MQDKAREHRDMLARIANSIGAGLLVVDRDFNIVWANDILQRWFGQVGLTPGRKCYEVFHGTSHVCDSCSVDEAFGAGKVMTKEESYVFPGGEKKHFLVTTNPIVDDNGVIVQCLEMVQDITASKRTEDELAQRLLYERMVQEISSSFLASSDLDEDLDAVLQKLATTLRTDFARILRFQPERKRVTLTHEWVLPGAESGERASFPSDLGDPWPRVLVASGLIKCSDTSRADRSEHQVLNDNGISSLLAVRFPTESDARGFLCVGHYRRSREWMGEDTWILQTVAKLIGLGFERRKNEEQVVESHKRYREILTALREGVGLVDENEKIRFCNPAFEHIFEIPLQDLIGRSVLEFADEDDRAKMLAETQRRRTGVSSSYELPIRTGKGNRKHLLVTVSPFTNATGAYEGAVGAILDITERKKAEEELKQFARQLQRSNELKDLFADILSHDLLDSVGVIKVYAETLVDNDAAPLKEFLGIILENTDKVVGIVRDAGELAKLEARSELETERVDLYETARETIESLVETASARGTSLILTGEEQIPVAASRLIREVFQNLISNAIKYGAEQSQVVVSLSQGPDDIRICVKDFGEGVPDEAKESIFERYRRASRGAVKGTRLGLAIAKRIIALHGGEIWVEDNPEGGAVFVVSLPISLAVSEKAAA